MRRRVVVITGGGAGVGRAAATEFARKGCDIALLSRDPERLETAARELRTFGVRVIGISTDVANADAVERAAERAELELGPIDIWVNVAMATIFAPVREITPKEFARATEVTYLGQVYGTMAALKRMRQRDRGTIVCVGSALAYRAIPLQSAYCGAKFAIRGFLDALRSELIHEKSKIRVAEVDLPAVNTPQFDWARNKTGHRAKPVAPVFQPEVAARAIRHAAFHPTRQIWVGFPTIKAILGNRLAPRLLDQYLAKAGYSSQLTNEFADASAPGNLFEPVKGAFGAHGRFDAQAKNVSWEMVTSRHKAWLVAITGVGLAAWAIFQKIKEESSFSKEKKAKRPQPKSLLRQACALLNR